MKEIPLSKVYEALTALASGHVFLREYGASVVASSLDKAYTVKEDGKTYSSNDNATYWQHYAGYPIIALLLKEKKIPLDETYLPYFKDISWKALNQKYKNKYDLSIKEAMAGYPLDVQKAIASLCLRIKAEVMKLDLVIKGNRAKLFTKEEVQALLDEKQARFPI